MVTSLQSGDYLKNRYLIQRPLSRDTVTQCYLAKDSHRFQELCVIQQWSPPQGTAQGPDLIKLKQFQTQAETLYQLYHAQIANFREFFADNPQNPQSWFLVRDHVEGQTYQERWLTSGSSASSSAEREIILLLQQLLPLIDYLNQLDLAFQALSPAEVVSRSSDSLPIVTELAPIRVSHGINADQNFYALGLLTLSLLSGEDLTRLDTPAQALAERLELLALTSSLKTILPRLLRLKGTQRFSSTAELEAALVEASSGVYLRSEKRRGGKGYFAWPLLSKSPWAKGLLLFILLCATSSFGWLGGKLFLAQRRSPDVSPSPEVTTSPLESELATKNALRARSLNLGIPPRLFYELVADSLGKTPDTVKTDNPDWNEHATQLLDALASLRPEVYQNLENYQDSSPNRWVSRVNRLRLSSRTLTTLVDHRFKFYFPELDLANLANRPWARVWQAIADDTVQSLEAGESYELLTMTDGDQPLSLRGEIQAGQVKTYALSLRAEQWLEIKSTLAPPVVVSVFSPTGEVTLVEKASPAEWSGKLPETGYYEILILNQSKTAQPYQLQFLLK